VSSFPASLVTPERTVLEVEVQAVMVRTVEGEAAFLPGHTELVGALVPVVVRFQREDGEEDRAAVHGGFVQVHPDRVVVLAPVAELAVEIDVDRARRALEEAERALAELDSVSGGPGEEPDGRAERERRRVEESRRRAEVRLAAAGGGHLPGESSSSSR
jgi:F-type H+-transporting ATPase subunit epsilon